MGQSGAEIEHVVVDGGSTDGTVELLEAYEDRYDLKWVSEPDDGQSDAINKGIEMATGDWICWVNSDDYLLPGAMETLGGAAEGQPGADVIYGDYLFVDAEGNEVGRKYSTPPSRFVHKHYYQFTGNHSMVIRRDTLDSLGGVDEELEYVMDADLLWRLLTADLELVQVQSFIGARRLHEAAKTTGTPPPERQAEMRELKSRYGLSPFERVVPDRALAAAALGLQGTYHLLDGRPEALRYIRS
ncbi:glycosyltransferase family 2 protein [Haloarcula salina]|uniref:glycosyltransferase family 2 protein n=1 Tax=Haloarcula salina TaxID=1429914 RepID=UPI003C6EF917